MFVKRFTYSHSHTHTYIYTVTPISIGYILFSVITPVYVRHFAWYLVVISRKIVLVVCGMKIKNSWLNSFFLSKFKITVCKCIGDINLIFCCVASVLFHCFQSLSIDDHEIFYADPVLLYPILPCIIPLIAWFFVDSAYEL